MQVFMDDVDTSSVYVCYCCAIASEMVTCTLIAFNNYDHMSSADFFFGEL